MADNNWGGAWDGIFPSLGLEEYTGMRPLKPGAKRVLCICKGGTVRSVALAFLLKYKYGVEALAASLEKNTSATLRTLMTWADRIFVVEEWMLKAIPPSWQWCAKVVDVGPDRWANPLHPELLQLLDSKLRIMEEIIE